MTRRHEHLHADLCEPFKNASFGGSKYFFIIIDYSRKTWTLFFKAKNNAFVYFTKFYQQVYKSKDKI